MQALSAAFAITTGHPGSPGTQSEFGHEISFTEGEQGGLDRPQIESCRQKAPEGLHSSASVAGVRSVVASKAPSQLSVTLGAAKLDHGACVLQGPSGYCSSYYGYMRAFWLYRGRV
jgi:hypothetical protein